MAASGGGVGANQSSNSSSSRSSNRKESIRNKIQQFLGINKSTVNRDGVEFSKSRREILCSLTLLKDIGPESSISHRIKSMRELSKILQRQKLEQHGIEAVWEAIKDLVLTTNNSTDSRHEVLIFLVTLISTQRDYLNILRLYFFRLIKERLIDNVDISYRIELLNVLTENGKDVTYIEEEIGAFSCAFLKDIISLGKSREFLPLLANIFHFNSSCLDHQEVEELLKTICYLCRLTENPNDLKEGLNVLDAVIRYSSVPSSALQDLVSVLCRTVNLKDFANLSWQVMRNLIGTHLGHSSVYIMCCILQSSENYQDINLLRGAVFFIGMCLWGQHGVEALKHSTTSVLPSFLQVLSCNRSIVAYEIAISVQRLIRIYGCHLQVVTWDILLDILIKLIQYTHDSQLTDERLVSVVHDILTHMEKLYESNSYSFPAKKFFDVLEMCSNSRPSSSVLVQISYHSQYVHPTTEGWIGKLAIMMNKYYKYDVRKEIRTKMLSVVFNLFHTFQHIYEDDITTDVILPHLIHTVLDERDHAIRLEVINFLVDVLMNTNSRYRYDILIVIKQIIYTPVLVNMESDADDSVDVRDKKASLMGLMNSFKEMLFRQSADYCQKIYNILVDYLLLHYDEKLSGSVPCQLRCLVFKWLLQLRINHRGSVGVTKTTNTDDIQFSPYLFFQSQHDSINVSDGNYSVVPDISNKTAIGKISFTKAIDVIQKCLELEEEWNVLIVVLKNMDNLLQFKDLMAYEGNRLDKLCRSLQLMISDHEMFFRRIKGIPYGVSMDDFRACVSTILEVMICYHDYLDLSTQNTLVKSFESGLGRKCTDLCIRSLTICLLEMPNVTRNHISSLLQIFAGLDHSVTVGQALLEFYSALSLSNYIDHNLSEEECRIITFSIIPYANPFIYCTYTVILAYHVLLGCFANFKISLRQDLGNDIIRSINNHLLESGNTGFRRSRSLKQIQEASISNQTSFEERPRSCSVNVGYQKGNKQPPTVDPEIRKSPVKVDSNISLNKAKVFHQEMIDVCYDFIGRVTFANYAANCEERSQTMEMLMCNGLSQTYVIDDNVITITTSRREINRDTRQCTHNSHNDVGTTSYSNIIADDVKEALQEINSQPVAADESLRYTKLQASNGNPSSTQNSFINQRYHQQRNTTYSDWAEVAIRRPTGSISWMLRTTNMLCSRLRNRGLESFTCESDLFKLKNVSISGFKGHQSQAERCNFTMPSDIMENDGYDKQTIVGTEGTDVKKNSSLPAHGEINKISGEAFERFDKELHICDDEFQELNPVVRSSSYDDRINLDSEEESIASPIDALSNDKVETADPTVSELSIKPQVGESPNLYEMDHTVISDQVSTVLEVDSKTYVENDRGTLQKEQLRDAVISSDHEECEERNLDESIRAKESISSIGQSPLSLEENVEGLTPKYVLFHLLQFPHIGIDTAAVTVVPNVEVLNRAVSQIDRIPPFSTHKIGIVYVDNGQENDESAILKNTFGSEDYVNFLSNLAQLTDLKGKSSKNIYTGGLDRSGTDGEFAYTWQDDTTQIVFHVATLMPNKDADTSCHNKKMHIGNDFITIVYDDSDKGYQFETIKGQFNFVEIVIRPVSLGLYSISVHVKSDFKTIVEEYNLRQHMFVSNVSLANVVRGLAMHYNMLASLNSNNPHASVMSYTFNWIERLHRIRRLVNQISEYVQPNVQSIMENSSQECDTKLSNVDRSDKPVKDRHDSVSKRALHR